MAVRFGFQLLKAMLADRNMCVVATFDPFQSATPEPCPDGRVRQFGHARVRVAGIFAAGQKTACGDEECAYIPACPNRTCLWSCVGGWRSGQEACEPSLRAGSRSEPVNPAKRGTRLKATTDRAFSSLSASNADLPKRLVYLAGRADRELIPIQSMAQSFARRIRSVARLHGPRRSI